MDDGSFRELKVWQKAMAFVEDLYRSTAQFPRSEQFGLTAQLRRAGVSIPSNIGEGKRRRRDGIYINHLAIALGSQAELEVQLEIAKRVGFLKEDDYRRLNTQVVEIGRMLNGLIASIRRANTIDGEGEGAPN